MEAPKQPITFTPVQLDKMVKRVSELRHNINNHLTLIIGAAELIRRKPEMIERMTAILIEQARKIEEEMKQFSAKFKRDLGTMDE
jgi:nitrogen-specific signal transduction histidine kinase